MLTLMPPALCLDRLTAKDRAGRAALALCPGPRGDAQKNFLPS